MRKPTHCTKNEIVPKSGKYYIKLCQRFILDYMILYDVAHNSLG